MNAPYRENAWQPTPRYYTVRVPNIDGRPDVDRLVTNLRETEHVVSVYPVVVSTYIDGMCPGAPVLEALIERVPPAPRTQVTSFTDPMGNVWVFDPGINGYVKQERP